MVKLSTNRWLCGRQPVNGVRETVQRTQTGARRRLLVVVIETERVVVDRRNRSFGRQSDALRDRTDRR